MSHRMHPPHLTMSAAIVLAATVAIAGCTAESGDATQSPSAPTSPGPTTPSSPASSPSPDADAAVADFYRDSTITFITGYSPGGGNDAMTRLIAAHLGQYIPGEPEIVVENMSGAGSAVAAQHLQHAAPQDGSVIGNVGGGALLNGALGLTEDVEIDPDVFNYLPTASGDVFAVIATEASGIDDFSDLLGPDATEGIMGTTGTLFTATSVAIRDVLGANVQLVGGYDGTAGVTLAAEQGEVGLFVGNVQSTLSLYGDRLESGTFKFLLVFSEERNELIPDVPTIAEFVESEEDLELFRQVAIFPAQITTTFLMPPGVPQERYEAMDRAFTQVFDDQDFIAQAEQADLPTTLFPSEDVRGVVDGIVGMDPEVADRVRELFETAP